MLENNIEGCGDAAVVVSGRSTEASVIMNKISVSAPVPISVHAGARAAIFTNRISQKEDGDPDEADRKTADQQNGFVTSTA